MDERLEKLPKWAQDIMRRQNSKIETLRTELENLLGREPTEISFTSYGRRDRGDSPLPPKIYLPGGRATVHLGKDKYGREHDIDVYVERNLERMPVMQVQAVAGQLYLEPRVCNTISVTTLRPDLLK